MRSSREVRLVRAAVRKKGRRVCPCGPPLTQSYLLRFGLILAWSLAFATGLVGAPAALHLAVVLSFIGPATALALAGVLSRTTVFRHLGFLGTCARGLGGVSSTGSVLGASRNAGAGHETRERCTDEQFSDGACHLGISLKD